MHFVPWVLPFGSRSQMLAGDQEEARQYGGNGDHGTMGPPEQPASENQSSSSHPPLGSTSFETPDALKPVRNHLNPKSATVYSLKPPIPAEHYAAKPYYSGPTVFIPVEGKDSRPVSHHPHYTSCQHFPDPLLHRTSAVSPLNPSLAFSSLSHGSRASILRCSTLH